MLSLIVMMFPFVMPWYDASPSPTSLSDELERPAGAHGFVTVNNGHFFEGGRRIRFVGMNFSQGANLPASKNDARVIAARLAKYGINCVRLAALDYRPAPEGILQPDMKNLDVGAMDKLDYFIYQLKENGIYVLLELHVARIYPGLPDGAGMPAHMSGVDNFSDMAISQQKEYASDLLRHFNPYIGRRYIDEPAIAMIEINNEDALFLRWWDGSLDKAEVFYQEELKSRWNAWLRHKYADIVALRDAWPDEVLGDDLLADARFRDHYETWHLVMAGNARAVSIRIPDVSGDDAAADISVLRPGGRTYDVQFCREPLSLSGESSYSLAFRARSDTPRRITLVAAQPAPYRKLFSQSFQLTNNWKTYTAVFTPDGSSSGVRLCFSGLGSVKGSTLLSDVSLRRGGASGAGKSFVFGNIPIISRPSFSGLTVNMQKDWLSFLADTEDEYWSGMYRYLKHDLGSKSLIIGTQQSYSPYQVQEKMDVIDMHGYWDRQVSAGGNRYRMTNTSQIGDRNAGVIGEVASRRIEGKPFIVSEYNYRGANTYASEADLLMFAYASLQDWDGVFVYNYANNNHFNVDRLIGDEGFNGSSSRFVALVPAALMFHRADIQPSREPVHVSVTREMLLEKMRIYGPAPPLYDLGLDVRQPLQTGIGLKIADRTQIEGKIRVADGHPIASDTGELYWDAGARVFKINTPRTKAVIGQIAEKVFDIDGIRIALGRTVQGWAAVSLSAMGGSDSVLAGRVLLTATGKSINTGMDFDEARGTYSWGEGPVLAEGVPATITLPVKPGRVRAWALDQTGNPRQALKVVDSGAGTAQISIGERFRTLWYLIDIR